MQHVYLKKKKKLYYLELCAFYLTCTHFAEKINKKHIVYINMYDLINKPLISQPFIVGLLEKVNYINMHRIAMTP